MKTIAVFLIALIAITAVNAQFSNGCSLTFNGSASQHVDLKRYSSLAYTFTLEAWIKPASTGTGHIFYSGDNAAVDFVSRGGRLYLTVYGTATAKSNIVLTTGEWQHVAVTMNRSSRQVTFYRNSQVVGTATLSRYAPCVSRYNTNIGAGFNGSIDEVRHWASTRTASQLTAFRARSAVRQGGLVVQYSMDECRGTTVRNQQGNYYHGTLSGSPVWSLPQKPVSRVCRTTGDPHVKASTGAYFHPQYAGNFWLVRYPNNAAGVSPFQVQVGQFFCRGRIACNYQTAVSDGVDVVTMIRTNLWVNKVEVLMHGKGYFLTPKRGIQVKQESRSFAVRVYDQAFETADQLVGVVTVSASSVHHVYVTYYSLPTMTGANWYQSINGGCEVSSGSTSSMLSQYLADALSPTDPNHFNTAFVSPVESDDTDDFPWEPPSLETTATELCKCGGMYTVGEDAHDACLLDVKLTGSIIMGVAACDAAYEDCLEAATTPAAIAACKKPCPLGCSGDKGVCGDDGVCTCDAGFTGVGCQLSETFACITVTDVAAASEVMKAEPIAIQSAAVKKSRGFSNMPSKLNDEMVVYVLNKKVYLTFDKGSDATGGSATLTITTPAGVGMSLTSGTANSWTSASTSHTVNLSWDRRQSPVMVLDTSSQGSSFTVTINVGAHTGFSTMMLATNNHIERTDIIAMPSLNTRLAFSESCSDNCNAHSDCGACEADSLCGWCDETNTCMLGNAAGATRAECPTWRYTSDTAVSKVIKTDVGYPISVNDVAVYLADSDAIEVDVYVTVVDYQDDTSPLDIMLLLDISGSFRDDLNNLKNMWGSFFYRIQTKYPNTRIGLSVFSDVPRSPHGSSSYGDTPFREVAPMSLSASATKAAINGIRIAWGADYYEAQLNALQQATVALSRKWRRNYGRVMFLFTDAPFHESPNTAFHPTRAAVKQALLDANVVPVFAVTSRVRSFYENFVNNDLGFGFVTELSSDSSNLVAAVEAGLTSVATTVKMVKPAGAYIEQIKPSVITGLEPGQRAGFQVVFKKSVGGTATGTVAVPGYGKFTTTVILDDEPTATASATISTNEDTAVVIKITGTSVYGDSVGAEIVSAPASLGQLRQYAGAAPGAVGTSGSVITSGTQVSDEDGQIVFVPNANEFGTVTFTYRTIDGCSRTSVTKTVTVNVKSVNDVPTLSAFAAQSTNEDTLLTISTSGKTSDVEDGTTPVVLVAAPRDGVTRQQDGTIIPASARNTVVTGTHVTYMPAADKPHFGVLAKKMDFFTVDSDKASSKVQRCNINVNRVNDAPDALSVGNTYKTKERASAADSTLDLKIDVRGDDTEGEKLSIEITSCSIPSTADGHSLMLGAVELTNANCAQTISAALVSHDDESDQSWATLAFSPPHILGATDSSYITITFEVTDQGAGVPADALTSTPLTITIAVENVDDPPTITSGAGAIWQATTEAGATGAQQTGERADMLEDGTLVFKFDGIDSDVPGTVTRHIVSLPKGETGKLFQVAADNVSQGVEITGITDDSSDDGEITNADGWVMYVPEANDHGMPLATVSFVVRDTVGTFLLMSDANTLRIYVESVNDAPFSDASDQETNEDTPTVFNLSGDDVDDEHTPAEIDAIVVSLPANGLLFEGESTNLDDAIDADMLPYRVVNTDNTVTYLGSAHFNGADALVYKVIDPMDAESPTDVVNITIDPVNDVPVTNAEPAMTREDEPLFFRLDYIDFDVYAPGQDAERGDVCAALITELPAEGLLFQVAADGVTQGAEITTIGTDGPSGAVGTLVTNPDMFVMFMPAKDANGMPYTSFSYYVFETETPEQYISNALEVVVFVEPVNDHPVSSIELDGDDSDSSVEIEGKEDEAVLVKFDGIDIDSDFDSEVFAVITALPAASAGVLRTACADEECDADFVDVVLNQEIGGVKEAYFFPTENLNGAAIASMQFHLTDHQLEDPVSQTYTVAFSLVAVNDEPELQLAATELVVGNNAQSPAVVISPTEFSIMEDNELELIHNVVDPDVNPILSLLLVSLPTAGNLTMDGVVITEDMQSQIPVGATLVYVPAANFNGVDSYTVQVTDTLSVVTQTVTINVAAVNDAPTLSAGVHDVEKDMSVVTTSFAATTSFPIMVNDVDFDLTNDETASDPITVTLKASAGELSLTNSTAPIVQVAADGTITVEGPLHAVQERLSQVTFTHNELGMTQLVVKVSDNGNYGPNADGSTGPLTAEQTIGLNTVSTQEQIQVGAASAVGIVGGACVAAAYKKFKKSNDGQEPWEQEYQMQSSSSSNPLYEQGFGSGENALYVAAI